MGMIRSAIEAMKALESLDKSKVREMRYCAILALVATAMLYTIPYICGFILDWMVESSCSGCSETNRNTVCAGGSSRSLRSLLAHSVFIFSGNQMTITL